MAKAHLTDDEYNWENYTSEYSLQVKEMEAAPDQGSDFLIKDWDIKDDRLVFNDNLHGNWKNLYSEIKRLNPKSVFECGCGGMYHLKNIKTLFPKIKISACDLLETQIEFGRQKFDIGADILKNVTVRDFSSEYAHEYFDKHEFVYSHAVMMHLSHEKALRFLNNMLKISRKYVYFIEGEQHNYMELLESLGEKDNWLLNEQTVKNAWLLIKKS